jgi:hypothetical protein
MIVEGHYLPFLKAQVAVLEKDTDVRIHLPPGLSNSSSAINENGESNEPIEETVIITGDKEHVVEAEEKLKIFYEELVSIFFSIEFFF